jgi:hypothetical protein
MARRKGIAGTTIIALFLGVGLVTGGAFALSEITNILQLIIGNLYYIILFGVITLAGSYFVVQSYQDKISQDQLYGPILILAAMAIIGSAGGAAMGEYLESYTATVEVDVDQSLVGTNPPELKEVSVNDIERKSPGIFDLFGGRQACIALCDGWKVEVEITCEGEDIGRQDITGKGEQTRSTTIRDLQEGQCKAVATPTGSMDGSQKTTYFNVG